MKRSLLLKALAAVGVSVVIYLVVANMLLAGPQNLRIESVYREHPTKISIVLANLGSMKITINEIKVNGITVWKSGGYWNTRYGILVIINDKQIIFLTKKITSLEIPPKSKCLIEIKSSRIEKEKSFTVEFVTSRGVLSASAKS